MADPMPGIRDLLRSAAHDLMPHSDSARLDAELLLCHVIAKPRSHLHAWPEQQLDTDQIRQFEQLLRRRQRGEPVAHLTGWREFWSLRLQVTPATLIPRPETEHLVELALTHLPAQQAWRVADLGTGSGAIALAIAHERPACQIIAVDRCKAALQVARDNAARLGLDNITFQHGDWLQGLPPDFDVIVANPPYIRPDDPHLLAGDLPYEPRTALVADANGMAAIDTICQQARRRLRPGGWLLLEHGYDQRQAVSACLRHYAYTDIEGFQDLGGVDRIVQARAPAHGAGHHDE